jgi:serine/threonine protein kinase
MGGPAEGRDEGTRRPTSREATGVEAKGGTRSAVETGSLSEAQLLDGRELADAYDVGDALGEGGMGQVLEAKDPRLGRSVAVKVLREKLLKDATLRRRFVIEAQVSAQLEHPHIVPVYSMEQADGIPAFAMRLLPGHDLAHLIEERRKAIERGEEDAGQGDLEDRLEIFLRVCDAIAYANDRGVIHRDLKPENVMLGAHREVYVVDWGVAKVIGQPELVAGGQGEREAEDARDSSGDAIRVSTTAGTRHGQAIGTLMYMPPEQIEGDVEHHSSASDQFALGMMLQELVTLETPRRDGTAISLMAAALEGRRREPVRCDGARIARPLRAIIDRATQKAPADRYPSIATLADDVRRHLLGEPVSVYREPVAKRLWRRLSKRPAVTMSVVLLLLLAGAATSLLSVRRTLQAERRARNDSDQLEHMSGAVHERSQRVDSQLARIRMLVEGLGAATEELVRKPAPEGDAHPFGAAGWLVGQGPAFETLREHERYGMPVTMDQSLYIYPAEGDEAAMVPLLVQLAPMHERMRDTFLRSAGPGPWSDAEMRRIFWEERPPVHMSYVSFENGLMITFPGYEPFPEGYDPRRRPWYVGALERRGPFFGTPYPDASNSAILVPCNRAVVDAEGAFIGVVGADMAMDDVIAALPVEALDGWERGGLVDREGRLIVDTENEELRLGFGLHDDEAFAGSELAPAIANAIEGGGTGWIRQGEHLVFFDRLSEIDWTFLAWVRP